MIIENLKKGKLIKRYKRFLADVELGEEIVTVHCPNSGSMKSLLQKGNIVYVSESSNPNRKLKYTLELIKTKNAVACVNTTLPNKIIHEAISEKKLPLEFDSIRQEVKYAKNSRIDLLLEKNNKKTFVEVKNVTLLEDELPGVAQFPDAVTTRGQKHLQNLIDEVKNGNNSVMVYLINRTDCDKFRVAEHIDKIYSELFQKAKKEGVEIIACKSSIKEGKNAQIKVEKMIDVL
ncbi:MAG: DNA/RNA nuclease SfsA [Candidatus Nanoarchaeia archaeon]